MASDTNAHCCYFHEKTKCFFPHLVTKHLKTLNAFTSKPLLVIKHRKEFIALRQKTVAEEGKREGEWQIKVKDLNQNTDEWWWTLRSYLYHIPFDFPHIQSLQVLTHQWQHSLSRAGVGWVIRILHSTCSRWNIRHDKGLRESFCLGKIMYFKVLCTSHSLMAGADVSYSLLF